MAHKDNSKGTTESEFRVGMAGGGQRIFSVFNDFLARMLWTPTAARDITIPDTDGTLAILKNNGLELKSIAYASLPTTGLPSTAIAWCPDFQYGTPPTSWAGPIAWNGAAWVPLYAGALPAATIAGQPLNLSQLGGAATVGVATITVPSGLKNHEETVSVPGTLSTNSVKVWLASTTENDENDVSMLEGVQIWGVCATDSITFYFSSQDFESGLVKLNYQVA